MSHRARLAGAVACLVLLLPPPDGCVAAEQRSGERQPAGAVPDLLAVESGGGGAPDLLAAESGGGGGGARRARASADSWLRLMADYASGAGGAGGGGGARGEAGTPPDTERDWFPRPIPITLPIGRSGSSLPVLILPVPVPADSSAQCSADGSNSRPSDRREYKPYASGDRYVDEEGAPRPPTTPAPRAADRGAPPLYWKTSPPQRKEFAIEVPAPPRLNYIVSSQQLVELYRAQAGADAELPPLLIPDYTAGQDGGFSGAVGPEPEPEAAAEDGVRQSRYVRIRRYQLSGPPPDAGHGAPPPDARHGAPPPPRFERSHVVRGVLTVPRAGYSEPYTAWWDARSGAARVDLHDGATSAYRMVLPDGRVQGVEVRLDRSGDGGDARRCAVEAPRLSRPADLTAPAFPDMTEFSFAGHAPTEWGRAERWTRTVSGHPGELGGARGEALTFRHEVMVARAPDNHTTTALRYSVAVDSSVLGADCDGYVHVYTEMFDQHHDPDVLRLDPDETCEETEATLHRGRTEPLREYTLPHRDTRYDDDFQRFKSENKRRYMDDAEEAVRKTLIVQKSRFVESGNRQGATSAMKVNYLGDRLDAELSLLGGVRAAAEGLPAERFPHSRDQLAAMRGSLPRAFDWRQRGAVTRVRNQGSCNSCWAFAVTGAVEGALFVRTRRLVPLSEQALVDCAQPFGAHGCGGTWPSAAYDYVQERGLPARAHYSPYRGEVLRCRDRSVPPVTHISSHVNVTRDSIAALKVAIRRHGPTVVIVAMPKSFIFHTKGVLYDDRCPKRKSEHAVLAVGWGEHRGETYFILKNSWTEAWGERGYIRVAAGANTCGVLSRPSYPRLERADVAAAAAAAPAETAQD